MTSDSLRLFGQLLRDRRNAVGWSRRQLAERAKLSDCTIKFLETAQHRPSRGTLIRLINIKELGLSWSDVPEQTAPAQPLQRSGAQLNCFIPPSNDSLRALAELDALVHGPCGHLEQSSTYLDYQSAAAYLRLCQQSPAYVALRSQIPLHQVASMIRTNISNAPLQIIALGVGDGTLTARLVQLLLDAKSSLPVNLCLVDISLPLLSHALGSTAALGYFSNLFMWGIQINLLDLPVHDGLLFQRSPVGGRRLFCMLGGTLSDLENEPRFFQYSLVGARPGDMLLLDIPLSKEDSDIQAPSALSQLHRTWFSGIMQRHCPAGCQLDFQLSQASQGIVPGSQIREVLATVRAKGQADRTFSVYRFRSYDPKRVSELLTSLGWEELSSVVYGERHADFAASALLLFTRRPEGKRGTSL
jgi:transcriptional regulator with XRE-family HTH domain